MSLIYLAIFGEKNERDVKQTSCTVVCFDAVSVAQTVYTGYIYVCIYKLKLEKGSCMDLPFHEKFGNGSLLCENFHP